MTVQIPLPHGHAALIDQSDSELVEGYGRWQVHRGPSGILYAVTRQRVDGSRRDVKMHRLIAGFALVDHRNGNGLDNRRANLRPATAAENTWNSTSRPGSSTFKGVTWKKRERRWVAQLLFDGKWVLCKYFRDEEAAARAYDEAARHYYGEFACLNFPQPGERSAIAGAAPTRPPPAPFGAGNAARRKGNGTSRFKGVSLTPSGRWRAQIKAAGRTLCLGTFANELDAARAYDVAARRQFGDAAALNFPRDGERSALIDTSPAVLGWADCWPAGGGEGSPSPALYSSGCGGHADLPQPGSPTWTAGATANGTGRGEITNQT